MLASAGQASLIWQFGWFGRQDLAQPFHVLFDRISSKIYLESLRHTCSSCAGPVNVFCKFVRFIMATATASNVIRGQIQILRGFISLISLHSVLIRNLIKLKGTAKLTAQGEQVCLKDSKYILFEILENRTWKGHTSSCRPSQPNCQIRLARLA